MMMKKNPIAEEGWQYDKGDDHTDMKTVRVKSVGYVRKNNENHVELVAHANNAWFENGKGYMSVCMVIPKRSILNHRKL